MTFLQSISDGLIAPLIGVVVFLIIAEVIMSWLVGFNVINLRNPWVAQFYQALQRITKPILDPIRRVIPAMGGLDFSPIIAFFGLNWFGSLFNAGGPIYNLLGG